MQSNNRKALKYLATTVIIFAPFDGHADDRFAEEQSKLKKIEAKIQQLESSVEKQQQDLANQKQLKSWINITAEIKSDSILKVEDLEINLDEAPIYRQTHSPLDFTDSNKLIVFVGPLMPGKRTLEIKARVTSKTSLTNEAKVSHQDFINKELKFDVPLGPYKKQMIIEFGASSSENKNSSELVQVDLKTSDLL